MFMHRSILAEYGIGEKRYHKRQAIFCSLIILIIIGISFFIFQKIYALAIYPRVYCCHGLNLGGVSLEQAETLLKVFVEKIEIEGFSFRVRTDSEEKQAVIYSNLIALADPDLSRSLVYFDVAAMTEEAFRVGRGGNFFKEIYEITSVLAKGRNIDPVIKVDETEIKRVLKENFGSLEKPAENAGLTISDDKLILTNEKPGFILDYKEAVEELKNNLISFKNKEIQIPIIQQPSPIKAQDSLVVLNQAQEIYDFAPYTLFYQNRKWRLTPEQIAQWFKIGRDELGQVSLTFNREGVSDYLQDIAKQVNIEPVERRLTMDNGRVTEFQTGQPGLLLNFEKSADNIIQGILNKTKEVDLVVEKIDPNPFPEDIANLGIEGLIGRGVSDFSGSPKSRQHNIKVGAEKLHGILIKPDEEFSLIKALGEVNEENGFLPELVIKGDRTIPEYGGGLCQIATTTFRAALNVGLPITERQPHSYRVVYYEPAGMDATLYTPHPDLKFINDTGYYILWQSEIIGDSLIFNLYGTPDGRTVLTTKTEISNVTQPGPTKFIETDELKPGEKKKVESSHPGADAKFKNIITFANGIVREEIWESHYRSWPEVWLIGKEIEELDSKSTEK